ncbi:MAG: CvpA family protein [Planctomycetota bacterium]|nr:CvpA family protein [Planctomycetota bacterium]
MFILMNLFVVFGVGLIAYWWANQGLFSAILHLICVIGAGVIALAFWEPLMYLILRGNGFDNYAWGFILIILFTVSLLLLRLTMDTVVGANVKLPTWANLVFGAPVGAAAGILTMGMFVIGAGFIQSVKAPFGYSPVHRSARTGNIEAEGKKLWIPVDMLTSEFFSWLSVTSLQTSTPMRHVQPELWKQASLVRDTYNKGLAQLSLLPKAAKVQNVFYCPDTNQYAIAVSFEAKARDFGSMLSLSRAQIRLIEEMKGGTDKPEVLYPDSWRQSTGYYQYDDVSHYLTSESGQQSSDAVLFFPGGNTGGNVKYLQIRNTRYRINRIEDVSPSRIESLKGSGSSSRSTIPESTVSLGGNIDSVLRLSADPRPIRAGRNMGIGTLVLSEDFKFYSGEHTFPSRTDRVSSKLAIDGLYELPGTRIIQLTVTRGGPADLYGIALIQAGENADIILIDSQDRQYWPMGYIHETGEDVKLFLAPTEYVKTIAQLPMLPSSGTHTLRLLFVVTENATVTRLQLGTITIGTCNMKAVPDTG